MITLNSLAIKFRSEYQSRISGSLEDANAEVRNVKEERYEIAPEEYTYHAFLTKEQAAQLKSAGYEVEFYS